MATSRRIGEEMRLVRSGLELSIFEMAEIYGVRPDEVVSMEIGQQIVTATRVFEVLLDQMLRHKITIVKRMR